MSGALLPRPTTLDNSVDTWYQQTHTQFLTKRHDGVKKSPLITLWCQFFCLKQKRPGKTTVLSQAITRPQSKVMH